MCLCCITFVCRLFFFVIRPGVFFAFSSDIIVIIKQCCRWWWFLLNVSIVMLKIVIRNWSVRLNTSGNIMIHLHDIIRYETKLFSKSCFFIQVRLVYWIYMNYWNMCTLYYIDMYSTFKKSMYLVFKIFQ